jgi:BCD family chlorophyll transporter-like MFS transporter
VAVGLGTVAFSMQDVVLEPYGGEILQLGVGATSALTALLAGGSLLAFALAARACHAARPDRVAACGALVGICRRSRPWSSPRRSTRPMLFRVGCMLIGFGGGLFSVGTLTAAMGWSAVNTSAWRSAPGARCRPPRPAADRAGGALRDIVSTLWPRGALGEALASPVTATASSTTSRCTCCSPP